jgi:hypothetical protein
MANAAITLEVFESGRKKPEYTIDTDIRGEVTAKEFLNLVKNTLIAVAKEARKEETSRGFDPKAVLKVDNKFGLVEEDVNPIGQIEYIARQDLREILEFSYKKIIELTRIITRTGNYAKNNVVLYNNVEVARTMAEFIKFLDIKRDFKNNDRIEFVNIAPYANRQELDGLVKGAGRTHAVKPKKGTEGPARLVKKPNGVYFLAHRAIKGKYKGNSFIKYQPILGQEIGLTSPERGSGVGRIRQTGKTAGRTYIYPAILILIKTDGVTQ